ncbi:MAG TPA: bifunctional diguanylate cyclase/phosphodiesterase [Burkholderiaceae bacterium]|nr:bifunctional diguanylate cyclase/phosphodiesterase [Burkholderiaceae bacterium]
MSPTDSVYATSFWNTVPMAESPDISLRAARGEVLNTVFRIGFPAITVLMLASVGVRWYMGDWASIATYVVAWSLYAGLCWTQQRLNQTLVAWLLVMLASLLGIRALSIHLAPLGMLWLSSTPFIAALLLGKRSAIVCVGLIVTLSCLYFGLQGMSFDIPQYGQLHWLPWLMLGITFLALYVPLGMAAADLLRRLDQALTDTRHAHSQTRELAQTDSLTGLSNLYRLRHELEQALNDNVQSQAPSALLFVHLDQLRRLNDLHGPTLGDAYLIEVAKRLQGLVHHPSLLVRSNGAEFIVLARFPAGSVTSCREHALQCAQQLQHSMQEPVKVPGVGDFKVCINIGLRLLDTLDLTVNTALQEAAIALSHSRAAGRNQVAVYDKLMLRELWQQAQLEHDLELALLNQSLTLAVQPQVDNHGQLKGAELLCRWTDPTHGTVPPDVFIAAAEKTGLIVPLGDWVLDQACDLALALSARHIDIALSVNVSLRQLEEPAFATKLQALLQRKGVPADRLVLEITESVLLSDQIDAVQTLAQVAALGVQFSIDDFGTGYSSLSYLKKLPLAELKIDRSFTAHLPDDANDTTLVGIIVSMAQALKLRTVAEGIETQAQADLLQQLGCHTFQGYHFARPMPCDTWLQQLPAP